MTGMLMVTLLVQINSILIREVEPDNKWFQWVGVAATMIFYLVYRTI